MSPELAAAAFSVTNNQVSDIIEMPYGYHIHQVAQQNSGQKLALTDKVPLSNETVGRQIKDFLTQQKTENSPRHIWKS